MGNMLVIIFISVNAKDKNKEQREREKEKPVFFYSIKNHPSINMNQLIYRKEKKHDLRR